MYLLYTCKWYSSFFLWITLVFSGFLLPDPYFFVWCFVDRCLSFCLFSFNHYIICPSHSHCTFGIFKPFFLTWRVQFRNPMHCLNSRRRLIRIWHIDIDYYMAFFISYPLSARGHDISPRADRLKGWYMNEGWQRVWYAKWHVMICLSYTSTEEITDLYQNVN
jgi:hypothetical protein